MKYVAKKLTLPVDVGLLIGLYRKTSTSAKISASQAVVVILVNSQLDLDDQSHLGTRYEKQLLMRHAKFS